MNFYVLYCVKKSQVNFTMNLKRHRVLSVISSTLYVTLKNLNVPKTLLRKTVNLPIPVVQYNRDCRDQYARIVIEKQKLVKHKMWIS